MSFRNDWFDLFSVQRTLKSLLQHHNSKAISSLVLLCTASHPYMTTGKIIVLTMLIFVSKVISLLSNTLSRFEHFQGSNHIIFPTLGFVHLFVLVSNEPSAIAG